MPEHDDPYALEPNDKVGEDGPAGGPELRPLEEPADSLTTSAEACPSADQDMDAAPLEDSSGSTEVIPDPTTSEPAAHPTDTADETWEPIMMEGEGATECPNCGAPMPEDHDVLCLRCGFDLTEMAQKETETGEVAVDEDGRELEEGEEPKPPMVDKGLGGLHLPAIMSGVAMLTMVIGHLVEAGGLYAEETGFWIRAGRGLQYLFMTAVFGTCLYGGLYLVGRVEHRKIGESQLAMLRCLGIAAVSSVVFLFVPADWWRSVEWLVEFAVLAMVFTLLARVFFRLSLREVAEMGCATAVLFGLIFGAGQVIGLAFS